MTSEAGESNILRPKTLRLHAKFQPPSFETEVCISHNDLNGLGGRGDQPRMARKSQGYM